MATLELLKEKSFQFQIEEAKISMARDGRRCYKGNGESANFWRGFLSEEELKTKIKKFDDEIVFRTTRKKELLQEIRNPKLFGDIWEDILPDRT